MIDIGFILQSALLGVGLAMDAFSVSLANGLGDHKMRYGKMSLVAGLFAFFQALMPMLGWVCVHTLLEHFRAIEKFIPIIALVLLLYIGGKLIYDSTKTKGDEAEPVKLTFPLLIAQAVATSIDALSVGFTIAEYQLMAALVSVLIIAAVTFPICFLGIAIGKKFGTHLAGGASLLGGGILITIGLWIFIRGFF